ncbi:hypothetical protein MTR_4g064220 [Medicago truncatula]|uniref:Uncharacterized protein n=1 Tax=Medicago truncatula TaxID=3880 RepID=G7JUU2_MEDTR|nr:hypothetical protein MTR_4g064220 [Medicago truncatula]
MATVFGGLTWSDGTPCWSPISVGGLKVKNSGLQLVSKHIKYESPDTKYEYGCDE